MVEEPDKFGLFSGNSNKPLANAVANHLGVSLGNATIARFADGEANIKV
jgi:ribose-phosphate pyrophosphokinase